MLIRKFSLTACLLLLSHSGFAADLPDFSQIAETASPAVVNITARQTSATSASPSNQFPEQEIPEIFRRFFEPPTAPRGAQPERVSGGSGFLISADGYVLTNHHVVADADEISVRLLDKREFNAKLVGSDPSSDVALLKLEAKNLPVLTLGDSSKVKPGQWVVAIGSPFRFDYTVTAGIVSAVGRSMGGAQQYVPFIQTDVPINKGNSGGPLFNLQGEVIGINSQIFSNTGGFIGLSFAIPIEVVKSVVEQLKTKGSVVRGYLGVGPQEVPSELAESLGLTRAAGALINSVSPGGAAEKAGIKVQDVITAFDGIEILNAADLPPVVGQTAPGSRVMVDIVRNGKKIQLPVVVGERPGDEVAAAGADKSEKSPAANRLGLIVADLSSEQRESLGLSDQGVLVQGVSGQAAARAGLQRGDVLLMAGNQKIKTAKQFNDIVAASEDGKAIALLVRRGEGTSFVAVTPQAK